MYTYHVSHWVCSSKVSLLSVTKSQLVQVDKTSSTCIASIWSLIKSWLSNSILQNSQVEIETISFTSLKKFSVSAVWFRFFSNWLKCRWRYLQPWFLIHPSSIYHYLWGVCLDTDVGCIIHFWGKLFVLILSLQISPIVERIRSMIFL